jgi:dCTP deaminase
VSILTGEAIIEMHRQGRLTIDPLDESAVGANSVDLTLADELLIYDEAQLDMRRQCRTTNWHIPPDGFVLWPGQLFLASTVERCGSCEFVCCVEGRSSVGRLGIQVHMTAGVGDCGFQDRWTLEMTCVLPVRIYAGVKIAQALFFTTHGDRTRQYRGKYKGQTGAASSMMWRDFPRQE